MGFLQKIFGKNDKESIEKKAKVALAKAEKMMDKDKLKRAAGKFQEAGDHYFELGEWRISERCYYLAGKNHEEIELYHAASNLYRLTANCSLLLHEFDKAKNYYRLATKNMINSEAKKKDQLIATSLAFTFLCEFIQGHQDKALSYVKRFKAEIHPDVFKAHLLIKLVHNLANAIYNEKQEYLKEVIEEYPKYKFRAAEKELIDASILVALCSVKFGLKFDLEQREFKRDELIDFNCILNYSKITDIINHEVIPHQFESIKVKDIAISLGENLSLKRKPELPIDLDLPTMERQKQVINERDSKEDSQSQIEGHEGKEKKGKKDESVAIDKDPTGPIEETERIKKIPVRLRTNFQQKTNIGPIMITLEIDGKFNFFLKTKMINVQIVSPKAVLGVELTPKETPVANQTFPLEVDVYNESEGDATDIKVEFEFPEEIRMMRGTMEKRIYALGSNENVTWQIQIKALDSGEIPITTKVSFTDGDGNEKGPFSAEIPVNINL